MQDNTPKEEQQQQNQEPTNKDVIEQAHEQADKDMEEDAEFTASSPNDDLDEEESARLGEDTALI
ncbi:hypothetical protein [Aridibaculum aurantiacum]|uniref:hypothetical protein n=1 Tax=Aridibaculum aurantiacum TaxID=2810307 RepID=UPI001A96D5F1|nr:hypothetical protein [Aridibaculum aurantiacum]